MYRFFRYFVEDVNDSFIHSCIGSTIDAIPEHREREETLLNL